MRSIPARQIVRLLGFAVVPACSHSHPLTNPGASEAPIVVATPVASAVPAKPVPDGKAAPPADAPPAEPPGDGRVAVPADFPEGTRSLEVKAVAHVFGVPADVPDYIGKITRGTRVGWKRIVAADPPKEGTPRRKKPCPYWVEIEPTGWLCKDLLSPSPKEPEGRPQPVLRSGKLAPDDYYKVMADETNVYKSEEDVRAAVVEKQLSTKVMVVSRGIVHIDGTAYQRTDHGLIEEGALARFWPSDFEGQKLEARVPANFPFAWVSFERGARKPSVRSSPGPEGEQVRSAARREVVPVLEERDGYVRVGEGEWLERKFLRVATLARPPAGLAPGQQWIDVDLDEQVLVAYSGTTPVFATLVSTGGKKNPTPAATYRVRAKAATTDMAGDPTVPNRYEVSAVPWAVRFADGFFVHGVYWHDGFGGPRSHGCVNVSPRDAAYLYDWIQPVVPDGWSEVEVPSGAGPIVRVRDREHPDPPPFDYSKEVKKGRLRLPPKKPK